MIFSHETMFSFFAFSSLLKDYILFVFNDYNRIWVAQLQLSYHRSGGLLGAFRCRGSLFSYFWYSYVAHPTYIISPLSSSDAAPSHHMPHCVLISLLLIWSRRLQPFMPLKVIISVVRKSRFVVAFSALVSIA